MSPRTEFPGPRGTSCYGWKGGIGTASRVLPPQAGGFTVGVLVQSNFGAPEQLMINGEHVGQRLRPPDAPARHAPEEGSIMMVIATDAPLTSRQLHRLCVRAGPGLARTGSHHGHGSGDFVIAFSTAQCVPHSPEATVRNVPVLLNEPAALDLLFAAVVESVEEAILNSLCAATTTVGRDGHVRHAFPMKTLRA